MKPSRDDLNGHRDAALRRAADLQKSLLARRCPGCDCLDICVLYEPADRIGGDFYDILPIGADHRCIILGDACGHETPAGIVMALMLGFVWGAAREGAGPVEIIRSLNTFLVDHQERCGIPDLLTTLFLGILDVRTLAMRYVNAGHPAPILRRAAGECSLIDPTGVMLGVDPLADWAERSVTLNAGDRLFLVTDGLTDAPLRDGRRLEISGLLELVKRNADAAPESLFEHLHSLLAPAETSMRDDRTLAVLTFHGHRTSR